MKKHKTRLAAILMVVLLAATTLAAPATASSYTSLTAPGSFTSSDSTDNTLSAHYVYDSDQSETVSGLTIEDSTSGVNGIVVDNADVDFSNITITLDTDADGSDTCDFTGKGTAFAVYGNANVTLSDATITTTGVATMPLFIDDGAVLTVQNTTITSNGGTLYSSYVNTADQSVMVAPPWVLGIMGTSRASNLMGTSSTLNFLDSTAYAAMWAVLSTDSGSNMVMNVYNSTLQLTRAVETNVAIQADGGQITTYDNPYTTNYGSGYGTYVIGSVEENMVGVTMNVGTYAAIFTGGSMSFSTLTAGDYTLSNADGSTTAYTYSGNARSSVINSDTFGFMAHQGDNTLTLNSGTALNTGYTGFLIKTGGSLSSFTANVTGTSISVGNNVLIQILDNEDSLIGTSSGTTFVTTYTESSGWLSSSSSSGDSGDSGDSGSGGESGGGPGGGESGGGPGGSGGNQGSGISTIATTASSSSDSVVFNFTNESALTGNIYNASGDQLTGTGVTVNLSGTTYYGAAASTTAIHVTYDGSQYVKNTLNGYAVEEDDDGTAVLAYQNTSITISEYYDLGHVANKICSNGSNTVTINLTDNSTWYVTGTSVLSSLSVDRTSQVILVGDATLTVNGTTYDADNLGDNMSHVDSLDDEEECDHVWDDGEVTTEATCTEDGEITYTCTLCGETKTETIEATGHTAGEAVTENEVAASCTEDGSYDTVVYCTVCGEEISRETTTVAATGHSYEAVVTAPTCTAGGYTTYTCTICGDSYVADETEATGHTWNDGEVTTAATCTEEGVMTYTCTTCGETKTEAIAATGHTEGEAVTENEVSATCTEDGSYDTVIYCTVCDAEISRETTTVAATGHSYEAVVTDATCTEGGYTTYTCSVCGDSYTAEETEATGHTWDDGEVTTDATCTEEGEMTYTCTTCGETKTEVIAATGHTAGEAVTENEVAASCTEDGSYDTVVYCTVCGEEISRETVTIPATGHTAGEAVVENEVEATCTEDGSYDTVVYCSVCEAEISRETVTIPATGHTAGEAVTENEVAATCTTDGSYDTVVYCTECDAEISRETTVIPATGHSYDDGVVTTAATCTEDGVITYTCTTCGETKTETIAATGHTEGEAVVENEVAASCTEDGSYDSVVCCTVCGEEISRETVTVPATGHTEGEAVVENEVAATCTTDGSYDKVVYCTVCGEELSRETVTVPATGHTEGEAVKEKEVAATCTTGGSYDSVVYCTACGAELSRETITSAATGHSYSSEVTTAATCTENGVKTYTCANCGDTYTEVIEATGHSYYTVVTEPTCTEQGYTTYTCSVCGDSYMDDYVEAKGHEWDDGEVTKEATETEAGEITYTCKTCEETKTEVIAPTGEHTYNEGEVTKEATCTEDGVMTYTCSGCGATYTKVIPATGHSYEATVTAPTCTENGYTTYTCTVCGDSSTADETAAMGHSYTSEVTTEATCTENGVKTYTCSSCGDTYTETIAATGHSYDDGVVTQEATCTGQGVTTYTCTVCGAAYTEAIEPTGHTYEAVVTTPTCTEGGYTTYTCAACGDSYTADETEATGHTYEAVVTAPTCTEGGYTTYTCTACGDSYVADETNATGHSYEAVVTAPTCTEGGYTTYTCTVCGDSYTADETEATGHAYGAPVFTWAEDNESCTVSLTCTVCGTETTETCTVAKDVTNADCTTGGQVVYTATATIDGQAYTSTKTVTIAATGHTAAEAVKENEVAATCTTAGSYDSVVYCTVCSEELSRETVTVPATGHVAGEAVVENEVAATCTEDGSYDSVTYCTVCGEELSRETVTVPATGHNYENGVCTVCGEKESSSGGSFWQNVLDWLKNLFGRWN